MNENHVFLSLQKSIHSSKTIGYFPSTENFEIEDGKKVL